jgi:hypothetical protein
LTPPLETSRLVSAIEASPEKAGYEGEKPRTKTDSGGIEVVR